VQNDPQNSGRRKIIIIGAIVLVLILIITLFFSRQNSKSNSNSTSQTDTTESIISDNEWGIKFPVTKAGNFLTSFDAVVGTTSFIVPSTGASVEQKYISVDGFSPSENNCTLPFVAAAVYRHKDENPGIDYSASFNLNKIEVKKVKVGDWWYSSSSIVTDGECFPGDKSQSKDYLTLASQYFSDFSKMTNLGN
jgi:hypothetical protein